LWLKRRGYQVRYKANIFRRKTYLAGKDQERGREFQQAWNDSKAKAIFVARGGYGAMRLFSYPSFFKLSRSPKIFMGMSDLTVLLNYLSRTKGIVTVHGPGLAGEHFIQLSEKSKSKIFSQLENANEQILRSSRDYQIIRRGEARGRLWGGNLTMIQSTLKTKMEIPFSESILFFEEVGEPQYRVDRMLAQLSLSGSLRKVRGVLLGNFTDHRGLSHPVSWLKEMMDRYMPKKNIPILAGLRAGHLHSKVLLPIGGNVMVESGGKKLILSPLVSNQSLS